MEITWREVTELENLGQRVEFVYKPIDETIAFVVGYGWATGGNSTTIYILRADSPAFAPNGTVTGSSLVAMASEAAAVRYRFA